MVEVLAPDEWLFRWWDSFPVGFRAVSRSALATAVSGVYLCSPTNSTMFTTCCHTAICDDQANCPSCGVEVLPHSSRGRWEYAYGPIRRKQRGYGHPVGARVTTKQTVDDDPLEDYGHHHASCDDGLDY